MFDIFIYKVNQIFTPAALATADSEIRARATEIINKTIIDQYTKNYNYQDVISIEKDSEGNIVMLKADTLKMNKIACGVSLDAQKQLTNLGYMGVKIPLGYLLQNNVLAYFGPSITIKMQPIGYIETKYISTFESAGINQTRQRIFVQVKTDVRVILPMRSNNITISNEVPIAETVIVGKIPETSINMDLQDAGFKLKNNSK